jgi:transcriptional regulator with XRE-family HTH domain
LKVKKFPIKSFHMSGYQRIDTKKLKALRQEKMLSQRDLAERIDSVQAVISELELGKRRARPKTVRKLAEVLGVEPKELVVRGGEG